MVVVDIQRRPLKLTKNVQRYPTVGPRLLLLALIED
jgi:hypothetical protein